MTGIVYRSTQLVIATSVPGYVHESSSRRARVCTGMCSGVHGRSETAGADDKMRLPPPNNRLLLTVTRPRLARLRACSRTGYR